MFDFRRLINEVCEYSGEIDFNNAKSLSCPECGSINVHPNCVVVNANGIITIIENNNSRIIEGRSTGRGVSMWLFFHCENGHEWKERYQFHKGETYKEVTEVKTADATAQTTIWRD